MTTRWVAEQDSHDRSPRNSRIAEIAQRTLHNSQYLALRQVKCSYHEGRLVLHGEAPSFYLVQLAQSLVSRLPEVEQIENRIQVAVQPAFSTENQPEPLRPRRFLGSAWDESLSLAGNARSA